MVYTTITFLKPLILIYILEINHKDWDKSSTIYHFRNNDDIVQLYYFIYFKNIENYVNSILSLLSLLINGAKYIPPDCVLICSFFIFLYVFTADTTTLVRAIWPCAWQLMPNTSALHIQSQNNLMEIITSFYFCLTKWMAIFIYSFHTHLLIKRSFTSIKKYDVKNYKFALIMSRILFYIILVFCTIPTSYWPYLSACMTFLSFFLQGYWKCGKCQIFSIPRRAYLRLTTNYCDSYFIYLSTNHHSFFLVCHHHSKIAWEEPSFTLVSN